LIMVPEISSRGRAPPANDQGGQEPVLRIVLPPAKEGRGRFRGAAPRALLCFFGPPAVFRAGRPWDLRGREGRAIFAGKKGRPRDPRLQ